MCIRVCEPGFSTVQVLYMSTDGCRNQPRPLSLFFCSQSRGARRNWKRPRAKVTLFNVVPPKKYLSLACFSLFSFMKRWTGGERVFLFSGCSLGKCCLPPALRTFLPHLSPHCESDRRFWLSRWIFSFFFGFLRKKCRNRDF